MLDSFHTDTWVPHSHQIHSIWAAPEHMHVYNPPHFTWSSLLKKSVDTAYIEQLNADSLHHTLQLMWVKMEWTHAHAVLAIRVSTCTINNPCSLALHHAVLAIRVNTCILVYIPVFNQNPTNQTTKFTLFTVKANKTVSRSSQCCEACLAPSVVSWPLWWVQ